MEIPIQSADGSGGRTSQLDELDWGYSQYFEIAAGNLKPFLAMTLFTEILCKHFPDVMSAPVKRLSSKL